MRTLYFTFLLFFFAHLTSAQEVPFQTGHTHDILRVQFSPDDRHLLSYSAGDGRLCLWEVNSGRLLWVTNTTFVRNTSEYSILQEFSWSQDETLLVTKSANGTYQTWDATTGKILSLAEQPPNIALIPAQATIKNEAATAVSHDGNLTAQGGRWGVASIKITELKTGAARFLDGHPSVVKAIAYSPDGAYFAVAGNDRNIYLFNAANQALAQTLVGHTAPVLSLAFNPDGKTLLSCSDDEVLKSWNWQNGQLLQTAKAEGHFFSVQKVMFSADGKYFLLTGDTVKIGLWDAQALRLIRHFKTKEKYEETTGDLTLGFDGTPVTSAMFSHAGESILSSHVDGTLRFWNLKQGEQRRRINLGQEIVFAQLSPDEKTIFVATGKSEKRQLRLLDTRAGKALRKYDDRDTSFIEAIAISPDGTHFATAGVAGEVLLWAVNQTKSLHRLDIGFSGDDTMAFSPDGKTLAVGGRNQNVFLFEVSTGKQLWQLLPSYQPSELETRLTAAQQQRESQFRAQAAAAQAQRDRQAAIDLKRFKPQVYITFEHYGEMTDPLDERMFSSGEPNKSKVKKAAAEATAIWLRLHNDAPLPIRITTLSDYQGGSRCYHEFVPGVRLAGLCDDREISLLFAVQDRNRKPVRYGFDVYGHAIVLPNKSVLFAVPRSLLQNGNTVRFGVSERDESQQSRRLRHGDQVTSARISCAHYVLCGGGNRHEPEATDTQQPIPWHPVGHLPRLRCGRGMGLGVWFHQTISDRVGFSTTVSRAEYVRIWHR